MRRTSVEKFEEWSGGSLFLGDKDSYVADVCIDSRKVTKEAAFFAIKGENYDGHNFIFDAIKAGATTIVASDAVILEKELKKYRKSEENIEQIVQNPFINVILVKDTVIALQEIAKAYLKELNIKVVAVTGSVGKTSVKDMIAGVCASKYYTAKTQGNFNNEIGLPLTILWMDEKTELAVLEMGMSHRGEIRRLAEIAMPQIGVVTNVGVSHIENLGSREEICAEKMDIATFFDEDCVLVLNADNDMLAKVGAGTGYRQVRVSSEGKADVMISHIESGSEIITFDVYAKASDESVSVRLARAGRHNAMNAALALAVGKELGICLSDGAKALENAKYQARRLEFKQSASGITIIDDTYNASPDSMRAALTVLSELECAGRKIAVLADMLEMGEESHAYHRQIGEYAAKMNIDALYTYGEAASYIAKGVGSSDKSVQIVEMADKAELIEKLKKDICKNDVVLVKGSNSMGMNEVANALLD